MVVVLTPTSNLGCRAPTTLVIMYHGCVNKYHLLQKPNIQRNCLLYIFASPMPLSSNCRIDLSASSQCSDNHPLPTRPSAAGPPIGHPPVAALPLDQPTDAIVAARQRPAVMLPPCRHLMVMSFDQHPTTASTPKQCLKVVALYSWKSCHTTSEFSRRYRVGDMSSTCCRHFTQQFCVTYERPCSQHVTCHGNISACRWYICFWVQKPLVLKLPSSYTRKSF